MGGNDGLWSSNLCTKQFPLSACRETAIPHSFWGHFYLFSSKMSDELSVSSGVLSFKGSGKGNACQRTFISSYHEVHSTWHLSTFRLPSLAFLCTATKLFAELFLRFYRVWLSKWKKNNRGWRSPIFEDVVRSGISFLCLFGQIQRLSMVDVSGSESFDVSLKVVEGKAQIRCQSEASDANESSCAVEGPHSPNTHSEVTLTR